MNAVTRPRAGWTNPQSGALAHGRPFAIVEPLINQIGQKRATELEEIRTALATEAAGRWAVMFLPFRAYTTTTPSWAGTWIAVRGRHERAQVVQADNPHQLRELITGGWWRASDRPAAA